MDIKALVDQVKPVFEWLGISPELLGVGFVLAVVLRYLRGMVHKVNSEWTYVAAVVFGFVGAWIKTEGFGKGFVLNAAALTCIVLIGQKVLEKLATKIPWLPQDNEWTKP